MGTPEIAVPVLEALNEKYEVSLVVTQEDARKGRGKKLLPPPVKEKAEELGIPVFQPHNINEDESISKLREEKADLFVVIAYGQIVKKEILDMPKECINIHASILPHLRGAAPINRAIIEGDRESGVSIMRMAEGLDTGDVGLVRKINIEGINAEELENKLASLSADTIIEFIEKYENGEIEFIPQDDSKSSYAKKINKKTGYIDFENMTSEEIINLINGLYPAPSASCMYEDKRFKIHEAKKLDGNFKGEPGEIIENNKKLYIKTTDGAISVERIQFPGKKAMDIKSFFLGNDLNLGTKLK